MMSSKVMLFFDRILSNTIWNVILEIDLESLTNYYLDGRVKPLLLLRKI